MLEFFKKMFTADFMPHGHCMAWQPEVLWLHVGADALIALSYYSIPVALYYFVRKRTDLRYKWVFTMFAVFILSCGSNHIIDIWTLWDPVYRFEGSMKMITAFASLATAVAIWFVIPEALKLPSPARLEVANQELTREIEIREEAQRELKKAYQEADRLVLERTEHLEAANRKLQQEIADREKIEKDLRESENQVRQILSSLPNAIILVDRQGKISRLNPMTEQIFQYSREELVGQPLRTLIPARLREKHARHEADFQREPSQRVMGEYLDLFALRKNGEEFPVEVGLNPVVLGKESFILASVVDISDRKAVENKLKEKSQALARSNAELEQFAYIASHDLQEPLRKLTSFSELLEKNLSGELLDKNAKYLAFISASASRMRELIRDLLNFSRIDKQEDRLVPTPVGDLVKETMGDLSKLIEENQAEIMVGPLPRVPCVPHMLKQVFQNLISNALKFRTESPPVIEIGAIEKARFWEFFVKDNGIGIEAQYADKVFELFKRLHSRFEHPGTGIGLAICKKVIEYHKGEIRLESEPGLGATFIFTIPKGG
ncbi:MAG TPA: PAS domain S-box protein [Calditrichia bacterium]|nr:PAS domain S-box protein [Calditrichia bacterium]